MPSMNFIPAQVTGDVLQTPFGNATLSPDRLGAIDGVDVMIGARPEHFHDVSLMDGEPPDHGMRVEAEIDVIEWLGSEQYAYIP